MADQGLTYSVDLALCIDATGSMGSLIERVKEGAINFERDFRAALEAKGKNVDALRVRVIVFRDLFVDCADSLVESSFYALPEQSDEFAAFVRGVEARGGGDAPESGLEALAVAIRSPWATTGDRRRHVIVLWTDTSPHDLEKAASAPPPSYPDGIPRDFDALMDLWEGQTAPIQKQAKRLVLFAPDAPGWNEIGLHWEHALHYPSQAGNGLAESDYATILGTIAESV